MTENYTTYIPEEYRGKEIVDGVIVPKDANQLTIRPSGKSPIATGSFDFVKESGDVINILTGLEFRTCVEETNNLINNKEKREM